MVGMDLLDLDQPEVREHVARCRACRHLLRTPESRALGVGPDCASRLGIAPRKPIRITGVPRGFDIEGQGDLFDQDG